MRPTGQDSSNKHESRQRNLEWKSSGWQETEWKPWGWETTDSSKRDGTNIDTFWDEAERRTFWEEAPGQEHRDGPTCYQQPGDITPGEARESDSDKCAPDDPDLLLLICSTEYWAELNSLRKRSIALSQSCEPSSAQLTGAQSSDPPCSAASAAGEVPAAAASSTNSEPQLMVPFWGEAYYSDDMSWEEAEQDINDESEPAPEPPALTHVEAPEHLVADEPAPPAAADFTPGEAPDCLIADEPAPPAAADEDDAALGRCWCF